MASAQSRYWQDLTTEDFAALDPARAIALLPVGAVEQHGPHLPLATDACIVDGIVARALELLPDQANLLVLPTQAIGDSTEHGAFPGTLSLTPETALKAWTEIGTAVRHVGLRKLVILNSHGGQPQVVDLVAQKLRLEQAMLVVKLNSFRLGLPPDLFEADELRHGIHGGAVETSMMLYLRPDLVRRDKLADFRPLSRDMAEDYEHLSPFGPAGFAWAAQDLHPSGAAGDPRGADAGRGSALIDHLAQAVVQVLAEMERFPLERLRS